MIERTASAQMLIFEPLPTRVIFEAPEEIGTPEPEETPANVWEAPWAKDAAHLALARRFAECAEKLAAKCFWCSGWDIVVRPVSQKDAVRGAGLNRSTLTEMVLIRISPEQNTDTGFRCSTAEIVAHEIAHILFGRMVLGVYDAAAAHPKASKALEEPIRSAEEAACWHVARTLLLAYPEIAAEYGEIPS